MSAVCAVEDCEAPAKRRGWCNRHYDRWWRWGTTDLRPPAPPVLCSIPGCGRLHVARGYCDAHRQRFVTHGDPLAEKPIEIRQRPAEDRFVEKVDMNGPNGCWLWTAPPGRAGYGTFRPYHSSSLQGAHRFGYEMWVGPIPEGLELDHLCRNPPCVNPAHLEPVTHAENMRRTVGLHRKPACRFGHAFTPENTFIRKNGRRMCRACVRRRNQQRSAA